MQHLNVTYGPTRVLLEVPKEAGIMGQSLFNNIRSRIDKPLTSWVRDGQHWKPGSKFYIEDDKKRIISVPVYYFKDRLRHELKMLGINLITKRADIDVPENSYVINPSYKDREDQIELLTYLEKRKGLCTVVEGDTGFGKTYCTIRIGSVFKETTLVVAPSLTKQWMKEARKITTLVDEHDVYEIAGYKSIADLYKLKIKPKLIIASPKTMLKYVEYEGEYKKNVPPYSQFIKDFSIGTKIIDEVHYGFATTAKIDLAGDVRTNIYLSATMHQSNSSMLTIFNGMLPPQIRYITDLQHPHTVHIQWKYPKLVAPARAKFQGSYSQVAYEKALCRGNFRGLRYLVNHDLIPAIDKFFIAKRKTTDQLGEENISSQRCLIFFNNKKTIREVVRLLRIKYGEVWTINHYLGGDPQSNLYESDMCVATITGAGIGKDIPNLLTIINGVSHASKIWAIQTRGRLRYTPNQLTYMVDLYSADFKTMYKHLMKRVRYLKGRLYNYLTIST